MKKCRLFTVMLIMFLFIFSTNAFAEIKQNQMVSKDKYWTIRFSQKMSLTDENKNCITIRDSKGNPIDITLDITISKYYIIVIPTKDYSEGETYTLTINKNIKSDNGNAMKNDIVMTFNIENKTSAE